MEVLRRHLADAGIAENCRSVIQQKRRMDRIDEARSAAPMTAASGNARFVAGRAAIESAPVPALGPGASRFPGIAMRVRVRRGGKGMLQLCRVVLPALSRRAADRANPRGGAVFSAAAGHGVGWSERIRTMPCPVRRPFPIRCP